MAVRDYSGFQAVVNSVEKLRETVTIEADKQLSVFRTIRDTQTSQLRGLERMVEGLRTRSQTRNNFGFSDRLELKNVRLQAGAVTLTARSVIVETKGALNKKKKDKAESEQLAKALGAEIKKIKVGGGLGNPLQILGAGILLQFGMQIAKGFEQSFSKKTGFTFKSAGQATGEVISTPVKAIQSLQLPEKIKKSTDYLSKKVRSVRYSLGEAIVTAIETEGDFTKKASAFGETLQVEGKRFSNNLNDDLQTAAENFVQILQTIPSVLTSPIDNLLRTLHNEALEDIGTDLVKKQAEKIAKENKKRSSVKAIDENTEELIIAVGGYAGAKGLSGLRIPSILLQQTEDNVASIGVKNVSSDIPREVLEDEYKRREASLISMAKPNIRGYSPDAIEMAAQALAALEKNPTIKIKLVGESGGGFVAEEATALLNLLGYKDQVEGVGVGTPDAIGGLELENFKKIISPSEPLGAVTQELQKFGLTKKTPDQQILGATQHPIEGYINLPEVRQKLFGDSRTTAGESRKVLEFVEFNVKAAKHTNTESGKNYYKNQFQDNLKEVQDRIKDATGKTVLKNLRQSEELLQTAIANITEEIKEFAKKTEEIKQDIVETPDKVEKETKSNEKLEPDPWEENSPNPVSTKQDTVETPDKVEKETKPNDQPDQIPIKQDTPGRPDGSRNQPPDRNLDIVPVGPVELPIGPRDNVALEADPTRGGGIVPLAGQLDTYQQTLKESLARVLEAQKAQTEIEIAPNVWVDVEQLNQGFVKRTQTQLILFWEKLRANLGKEINRTLAGLLGTIPGAVIGRGLTGDPAGGFLGGMAGRLIAETGFQDVSNFRSLQQQGLSPATAEFWQQFGQNRKSLPNTLRKTAVGYVTGSVVGRGISDVMQATGANRVIGALMPSWLEDAIGDGVNRTIKTIADPNIDLAIPHLPPAANRILSAPLHAVGNSVAAQGFLGNMGLSFLDGQAKTALMPVREALTGAGQAIGGDGFFGEYLGNRFTGIGIETIQNTAKASGRGVAGMIAPGLPAEVRNFIADQVIKQGVLDGTVRDQVAPFLASRAGTDVFARGVKVPITGKVAGAINQTLDKYDPYAIAPKQPLTDEQILLNREQRLNKKRTNTINAVENLFNRIDKSVDETTKAVVGIGNGFLGFFDNIRSKTYDFAKQTAGLADNPVTLVDQYAVYLDKLIQDAQKQAEETVKGIIPDYKKLTIPERKEAIGSYKEKVATEVKKFRMAIEDGESQIALEIGENILALVQSTRKVYKDLLEAVPSDLSGTKSIQANQRYLTNVQTEVLKGQPNLKGRAKTGLMQLVGTETSEGFIKGIEDKLNQVRNSGKDLAESAIEGAKKRLGIASPSKEFEKLGESSGEGFQIGIEKSLQDARSAIAQKIEKILNTDFYHGTSKAAAKSIRQQGIDVDRVQDAVYGKGFYLTDKLGEAESYASEHRHPEVLKARLNVKNPFIVTEKGYQNFIKHAQKRGELIDPFSQEDPTGEKYQQYHRDKTKLLQKKGYDSIFVRDKGFAVAFEADQVKLEKSGKNASKSMIASIKQLLGQVFDAQIEAIKAEVAKELKGIVKPSKLDKFLAEGPSKTLTSKGLDAVIYRLNNSFNLKPEHQKMIDKLALYGRSQKPSIIRMHGSDQKHKVGDSVEFPSGTSFTGKVDQVKKTGSLSYLKLQPGGSLYEVVNPKRGFDVPYGDSSYNAPFAEEDETITSGKYKVVGKKQKTISVNYGEKDGIEKLKVTIYQLEEIRSEIDKSISLLSKPIAQLKSAFDKLGKDTIEGFVKGVQGNQSDAIEVIAELVDSVIEKAKEDLEIQSPSKKFRKMGQQSSAGFAEGLEDGKEDVKEAVGSFWDTLENVPILGWFIKFGRFLKKVFAQLITEDIEDVKSVFNSKSQPKKSPKKQAKVDVDQEAVQEILNMDFYHGTSKAGEKSILEKGVDVNRVQDAVYGKGFYLANKREEAESYANDHKNPAVLKAKIKVKNPFIVTEEEYQEFIKNAQKKGELIDPFAEPDPTGKKYEQYHKDRTKLLQKKGYDSIFIKDKGFAVIFEAQQVEFQKATKKASKEITNNFYTRYIAYLDNLKAASKKHAMQKIASDDYKALSQQDKLKVGKQSFTEIKEQFKEFKEAVAVGNKELAAEVGEQLVTASETLKTIYDDLLQNLNSDDELFKEIEKQKTALEKLERKTIGGKANQKGLANIALETNRSLEMGESVGDGFVQGIENKIKEAGIASEKLSEETIKAAEKRLGISSPSKVFKGIGEWVVKGFNQGIDKIRNYEGVFVEVQEIRSQLNELNTQAEQAYYSEILAEVDSLRDELRSLQFEAESVLPPRTAVDKFADSVQETVQSTNTQLQQFAGNTRQHFDEFFNSLGERFPVLVEFKDVLLGFFASLAVGNVLEFLVGQIVALGNASFGAVLELESMRLAFTSVAGSAEAGAKGLAFVREEAQRLGVELKTAEEAYAGFLAVTKYTALQGNQADRIFSVFQETAARRGLSNEEQGRMFAAINQAISKRKLSAEEVRGQLGEIPGLAFESTVARSMGVNPAQLSEMMGDGLLMAEDVFPKVAALYEAENAKIAGSSETTSQALTRFQNAIVNLQRSFEGWIAPAKTFFNFFAAAIEKISEILPNVIKYLTILGTVLFIDFPYANLIKFFASLKTTQAIAGLKTVKIVVQDLTRIAVAAFNLIKKEFLAFLAQFALLTLAVDAWWAAIYILSNNAFPELKKDIEEATKEANRLKEALNNVGKATQAIPTELPKTEEEIVTNRTWNILGWDTGFNLEGTRQFFNNLDTAVGFKHNRKTLGQQELANFQENVGGLLSQVNSNLMEQFNVQKVVKEIKELEKELNKARSRQFNIPAGDKKAYEAAIAEQQKFIEEIDKKFDVTANFETALQNSKARIEKQLKALDELVARKGITSELEKANRAYLEQALKDVDQASTAFDDLMSNLQKSVNALTLALRNLNEQAAYFNETLERNATNARVQFMRRARASGVGSQVTELGLEQIDRNTLESRVAFLRDQLSAVNNELSRPDFAAILSNLREQSESLGINLENTATIDRIISENRSQQETAVLNTLKEQLRLKDELGKTEENLERSISSARSAIRDMNQSVEDFFFNLTQQIEEALVETDRILNKLKYTDIRNKLQRALVPGSDTFVNGLIGQIQGIFDRASGILEQVLGQRSARINFAGERRGLQDELENFTRNLGGATEALELFRQGLLGNSGQGSGVSNQGSVSRLPVASGSFPLGKIGSTGIGSGPHLHFAGKDAKGNVMTEARLREYLSQVYVDGKPLSEQINKITSGYGRRRRPVPGASDNHLALDFGFPQGTPLEFRGQASSGRSFFTQKGGNTVELTLPNGEKLLFLHLDSVANLGTIRNARVNVPGNTSGNTPRRGMPNVPFASLIEGAARQYGLDPLLFAALIKQESGFRQIDPKTGQTLKSYNGTSFGIAQLKNSTARELGVNPHNVTQNLIGGAEYLAKMLKQFGGNIELALAAYNAGPGNVQKYKGIPPFTQTQNHVRQIIKYYDEFKKQFGTVTAQKPPATPPAAFAIPKQIQSVLVQEVGSKTVFSKNASTAPASPASTIKLIVADILSKEIKKGTIGLKDQITIKQPLVDPHGTLKSGNRRTVQELIDLMLRVSDNTATNVLIDLMGGLQSVTNKAQQSGYTATTLSRYLNIPGSGPANRSNAVDTTRAMQAILSDNSEAGQLAEKSIRQTRNFKFSGEVGGKIGNNSKVIGNVGIVSINGKEYIVTAYANVDGNVLSNRGIITNATNLITSSLFTSSATPPTPPALPATSPTPPATPTITPDNSRAQELTNRLIDLKNQNLGLEDINVRREFDAWLIQLKQEQAAILRQLGDSMRQSRQSITDTLNNFADIQAQYSPQTQSAQLESELRGVENQFLQLDTQLFEQERGLSDNIQGLDNLLNQMKAVLVVLHQSNNQVDKESASFLMGLIGQIEQDKAGYSGMLTQIQSLRGELKQGKIDAQNFVQAQAKLRTIQADLERIGTELNIAQQQNNIEQEKAISLLQSRQQLELDLLQISQDYEGEDRDKRLTNAKEEARLREQEIEYQFQSKKLNQETELISQRLAIAQSLSNLGKINELEILQSQKQLEQEILEIKKQYPNLAEQELRINLAREQARLREIGFENNYLNGRWAITQELFDMESRIVEARAEQLEASGQNFQAAVLREELAMKAELLRYEQEIEAIRQRYPNSDDWQGQELIRNATILRDLNLEKIDRQFKDLGETIRDIGVGAFSTFLEETLTGTKSIGDAFLDMAKSILQSLAQIAAKMAISGLFRWIGISGFADGGTVPNYADGDTVKSARVANLPFKGIQEALRKEGPRGVLAVFTPGEEILSLRTGEAQRYQALKMQLGTNPLAKIGNFADGGTIAENLLAGLPNNNMSDRLPNGFGQNVTNNNYRQGERSVTVNVTAPNPSAFNASERQIGRVVAEYLSRV